MIKCLGYTKLMFSFGNNFLSTLVEIERGILNPAVGLSYELFDKEWFGR